METAVQRSGDRTTLLIFLPSVKKYCGIGLQSSSHPYMSRNTCPRAGVYFQISVAHHTSCSLEREIELATRPIHRKPRRIPPRADQAGRSSLEQPALPLPIRCQTVQLAPPAAPAPSVRTCGPRTASIAPRRVIALLISASVGKPRARHSIWHPHRLRNALSPFDPFHEYCSR